MRSRNSKSTAGLRALMRLAIRTWIDSSCRDPRLRHTIVITKTYVTAQYEGEYVCRKPCGQADPNNLQIQGFAYFSLSFTDYLVNEFLLLLLVFLTAVKLCSTRAERKPLATPYKWTIEPVDIVQICGPSVPVYQSASRMLLMALSASMSLASIILLRDCVYPPCNRCCRNGNCLKARHFCDENRYCADRSDEDQKERRVVADQPISNGAVTKMTMVTAMIEPIVRIGLPLLRTLAGIPCTDSTTLYTADTVIKSPRKASVRCPPLVSEFLTPSYVTPVLVTTMRMKSSVVGEPQILSAPRDQSFHRRVDTVTLTCKVAGRPSRRIS
uniref:Uncharacterized protein n=1 Tax=Echinococcus canadensis TaxID=519352 RepID=A0A915EYL0_9CEST